MTCEGCGGAKAIQVPAFTYPSAFGRARTEPKIVACPLCTKVAKR